MDGPFVLCELWSRHADELVRFITMGAVLITYNSRPLCRSTLDELIRRSPFYEPPSHALPSLLYQDVITGTRSTRPPLACLHIPKAEAA